MTLTIILIAVAYVLGFFTVPLIFFLMAYYNDFGVQ